MHKIKMWHVFLGYWLVGAVVAMLLPHSSVPSSDSVPFLPPLFRSMSELSVDPARWGAFFQLMSIAFIAAVGLMFIAAKNELGPPKTGHVWLLAVFMLGLGLTLLYGMLSIQVSPDTELVRFGAMLQSRVGLALIGSMFLAGMLAIFTLTVIVAVIAVLRHVGAVTTGGAP
jgi:hypothetical protein